MEGEAVRDGDGTDEKPPTSDDVDLDDLLDSEWAVHLKYKNGVVLKCEMTPTYKIRNGVEEWDVCFIRHFVDLIPQYRFVFYTLAFEPDPSKHYFSSV